MINIGSTIASLPSPVVLIERNKVMENIQAMAKHATNLGVNLRPHWKTSKSIEVAQLQLEAGAIGLTAATLNEVRALASAGIKDIFWAYPPVGAHRINAALDVARHTRLILGPDSIASATVLAQAAEAKGMILNVRLEVDTGVKRTGVKPERAVETAKAIASMPGLHLEGIFMHEGHVQGVGANPELRTETAIKAATLLVEVADAIRQEGVELQSVSVGSTAGAQAAPTVSGVTEARPGTYVYGDENQVAIGTVDASQTAMTVLSRVISTERGEPVLIDAGIKAMSSDGSMHGDKRIGTVVSEAGGIVAMGHEEHGFLEGSNGLNVGDLIRIRPNHACGLTNMHTQVVVVENDTVVDVWKIQGRH